MYNSEQYLGFGVKHFHTTQEIIRIKDILGHVCIKSNTDKMHRTFIELLILEVGLGTEISYMRKEILQILATDSLVKRTCQFLLRHHLELRNNIQLLPLSERDQVLMRLFLDQYLILLLNW